MTLLRGESRHMATRALLIFLLGCNNVVMADELPDPVAATWQAEPVCETLSETAEMSVFRCIFPPGVGHERYFHSCTSATPSRAASCALQITDAAGTREVNLQTGGVFFQ